jgi:hypothetical protein
MPLLMVTGHQRSGTTILRVLLNSHPQIAVTNEFANLKHLGRSRFFYSAYILKQLLRSPFRGSAFSLHRNERTSRLENARFLARYLARLQMERGWTIGFRGAESTLRALFPGKQWVGDKFPDYIWSLRYFSGCGRLRCIVIHRDARDVASSTLEQARTEWRNKNFVHAFDTPEKIARRWVKSIELMEECAGKILVVRYERLITEPKAVAEELGRALDVDPAYFPIHILHPASIGKHRSGLDPRARAEVESIAGAALARLGYS